MIESRNPAEIPGSRPFAEQLSYSEEQSRWKTEKDKKYRR